MHSFVILYEFSLLSVQFQNNQGIRTNSEMYDYLKIKMCNLLLPSKYHACNSSIQLESGSHKWDIPETIKVSVSAEEAEERVATLYVIQSGLSCKYKAYETKPAFQTGGPFPFCFDAKSFISIIFIISSLLIPSRRGWLFVQVYLSHQPFHSCNLSTLNCSIGNEQLFINA